MVVGIWTGLGFGGGACEVWKREVDEIGADRSMLEGILDMIMDSKTENSPSRTTWLDIGTMPTHRVSPPSACTLLFLMARRWLEMRINAGIRLLLILPSAHRGLIK